MARLQGFIAVCFVAFAAFMLLPDLFTFALSSNPVEHGTQMLFQVEEDDGKEKHRYGVKLRFKERPEGGFRLDIMTPHAVRSLNLEAESLEPTADRDNDPLEFPTLTGVEVLPAIVWLHPSRRIAGMNCMAGLVAGMEGFGPWQTWQVAHPDGEFYFEVETGMLAGFEVEVGRTRVTARLRSLR